MKTMKRRTNKEILVDHLSRFKDARTTEDALWRSVKRSHDWTKKRFNDTLSTAKSEGTISARPGPNAVIGINKRAITKRSKLPEKLVVGLKEVLGHPEMTDGHLAKLLKVSNPALVTSWRSGESTPQLAQIEKMFHSIILHLVSPIVEMEFINVSSKTANDKLARLVPSELKAKKGIYIFYDSQGKPFYVGKTQSNLHGEVLQRLKTLKLKTRTKNLRKQEASAREIATYLSAYQVSIPPAVDLLEAIIIRSMAGGLVNNKMENLPH